MFKIDLHTHSSLSPDGGITIDQYQKAIDQKLLDLVAVTDHNTIDQAIKVKRLLGDRAIIGEEIMTTEGEIIGLFLSEAVAPALTPDETIKQIKAQHGLVYIPHPFETIRHGLHPEIIDRLIDSVDLIEVYNGRAFAQNRSEQAAVFAKLNQLVGVASSDAHGFAGLGQTFTDVSELPNRENFLTVLAGGTPIAAKPSVKSLFYPTLNRLKKRLKKDG